MHLFQKYVDDTEASQQVFHSTPIGPDSPGSILKDCEIILREVGTKGLTSSSRNGSLPNKLLPDLNERMADPIEIDLKRASLMNYPNILGVFLLLRTLQIIETNGKSVYVDTTALEAWHSLSPTEQYFTLFETWLWHTDPKLLDQRLENSMGRLPLSCTHLQFLNELPKAKWKTYPDWVHTRSFHDCIPDWSAQLLKRFGVIEIEATSGKNPSSDLSRRGWRLLKARLTQWGRALNGALLKYFQAQGPINLFDYTDAPADFGVLQPTLSAWIPAYQKTWRVRTIEAVPGSYVFEFKPDPKSGDAPFRRVIRINGTATLDDLVDACLTSIAFDDDHLYRITYRSANSGTQELFGGGWGEWEEDEPMAHEVEIKSADLKPKQTLSLLYDFGDDWRFDLKLLRIEPVDDRLKRAEVIESEGTPPEQYPSWEDDA
ncbi:MAG: hypothetical protein JJT96_06195 [Opitutales bacterium]|nr:hypothetical protein [Opitutales bacterium]